MPDRMLKFHRFLLCLLTAVLLAAVQFPAFGAPAVMPLKAGAKSSLYTPIQQLGQQFQSLVVGSAAPAANGESDENNAEPAPTFGTRALNLFITAAELLRAQGKAFVTNVAALPQLSLWFDRQINDPNLQNRWKIIGSDFLYRVGPSFLIALLLELSLIPIRSRLRKRRHENPRARIAALLTLFLLRALPIMVFIGVSTTLLDQNETQKLPRFIILNVVYALALSRIVVGLIKGIFMPHDATLRLVPLSDGQARYFYRWLGTFSLIIIYGYFLGDVARAVHVPDAVIATFANIFGLILVLMTIIVIVQKRAAAAVLLRGGLSAAKQDLSWKDSLRLWLARYWHVLAIAYLFIGYAVAALGISNGFALILRGTILTLLILIIMRWVFERINRWGARDTTPGAAMHHMVLRCLMKIVIGMLAILGIVAAWGVDIPALFATPFGLRLLGAIFSISVTVIVLAVAYEGFSSLIDRHLSRREEDSDALKASARVLTLLPMIRNTVFIALSIIVALVVLSELGLNIGPLLAGAGIVGVAVGFGSQTLVKDFLTGLFIVIENTIAIGDVVKIGDHSGVVEAISVRTLRLRDQDGAVHILPFSEVTKVINMTRDFAFAVISVKVAYDTDLDRAMAIIRSVGEELQKDPVFKRVILEPIEILGVDSLGDYSITLLARLRTRPGKQWDVKRMFLLKLKQRFDKEGIEIPLPMVVNVQKPPLAKD
jgi:small-conductance mechanosensitive channel